MSFFVSESLKGLLTEEELVDSEFSKKIENDAFIVVIGNNENDYFFEIKNYNLESGVVLFELSNKHLEKIFFNDLLIVKSVRLGTSEKAINHKFQIKNIKRQKNYIDYEVEIIF
jgi:hypothetical protein